MDPVQAGLACGSDTSHLSMFGYDPRRYYRGRGAFETMGAGLEMRPGDIAFKVAPPDAYSVDLHAGLSAVGPGPSSSRPALMRVCVCSATSHT